MQREWYVSQSLIITYNLYTNFGNDSNHLYKKTNKFETIFSYFISYVDT